MKFFILIGIAILLSGCRYKIMSKEDRVKMITDSMIVGYQMGYEDGIKTIIPETKDFHLRDLNAETNR